MNRQGILLVIALLWLEAICCFAQTDSLVSFEDLHFESQWEQDMFLDLYRAASPSSAFNLLMTIGSEVSPTTIREKNDIWQQELQSLKNIAVSKKKAKYYAQIYEDLHDHLLVKYEEQNLFYQVFDNGRYNCVSACALYALAMEDLGISYTVKETPTHVYLIIDPEGEQYILETTDPVQGLNKFSSGFKGQFVQKLADQKLIGSDEVVTNSEEFLFEKYYFNEPKLSIRDLVAIQYSNYGIYMAREHQFDKALIAFAKAQYLYPSTKHRDLLYHGIAEYLAESGYEKEDQSQKLSWLARFDETEVADDFLVNEFRKVTRDVFIQNGNDSLYQHYYAQLSSTVKRKAVLVDLGRIYHFERGRVLFNRGYFSEAIGFAAEAFRFSPNNSEIETLMISCIEGSQSTSKSGDDVLNMLSDLAEEFPILQNNNHFGGFWLNAQLGHIAELYEEGDLKMGNALRGWFEAKYHEHPDYLVSSNKIAEAYSQLSVYYFKKGNYDASRQWILKGMEFAPDSYELKERLRMVGTE